MLFERLEEETLTEASSDPVSQALDILRTISEPVKTVLADDYDNEQAIKSSDEINNPYFNWSEAEKLASDSDKEKLAKAFTLLVSSKYPQYKLVLDNAEDIWTHIVKSLGYEYKDNPFLRYVYYYKYFEPSTIRSQLITLNNLYSSEDSEGRSEDQSISARDLTQSKDSLLYNPNLWKLSNEDVTIIVTKYNYVKRHRKLYSSPASVASVSDNCKGIYNRIKSAAGTSTEYESLPLEKYIVLTDGTNVLTCNIENASSVKEFVDKYFTGAAEYRQKKEETQDTPAQSRSNLDRTKRAEVRKFIQNSGIRARDVKDITTFLAELVSSGELR